MKRKKHDAGRVGNRLRLSGAAIAVLVLAACEPGQGFNPFRQNSDQTATNDSGSRSVKLVERDIEAPDVFQVTEAGLWDGRPSLGGVWAAHPDVRDPERVIIRNTSNNKFVIGALFRKERDTPGPRVQLSSDAAAALGMIAGQPVNLNVTALRREEVKQAPPVPTTKTKLEAPAAVAEATLDPVKATAEAAIAAAEIKPAAKPTAKPTAQPSTASGLAKPFVQIGIFSVQKNANNTAESMRQAGMIPTVKKQTSQGKTFWRVVVGPATSKAELDGLLKKIKAKGFADAYAVTN